MNFKKLLKIFLFFSFLVIITILILLKNYSKNFGIEMTFQYVKINDTLIAVNSAITQSEKSNGLSNVKKLPDKKGMLFFFDNDSLPGFWMKDMLFPIDIIWISENKIVGIEKNVQNPMPDIADSQLKIYFPPTPIDHALEVNAGFCDKYDIKVGDGLILNSQL